MILWIDLAIVGLFFTVAFAATPDIADDGEAPNRDKSLHDDRDKEEKEEVTAPPIAVIATCTTSDGLMTCSDTASVDAALTAHASHSYTPSTADAATSPPPLLSGAAEACLVLHEPTTAGKFEHAEDDEAGRELHTTLVRNARATSSAHEAAAANPLHDEPEARDAPPIVLAPLDIFSPNASTPETRAASQLSSARSDPGTRGGPLALLWTPPHSLDGFGTTPRKGNAGRSSPPAKASRSPAASTTPRRRLRRTPGPGEYDPFEARPRRRILKEFSHVGPTPRLHVRREYSQRSPRRAHEGALTSSRASLGADADADPSGQHTSVEIDPRALSLLPYGYLPRSPEQVAARTFNTYGYLPRSPEQVAARTFNTYGYLPRSPEQVAARTFNTYGERWGDCRVLPARAAGRRFHCGSRVVDEEARMARARAEEERASARGLIDASRLHLWRGCD